MRWLIVCLRQSIRFDFLGGHSDGGAHFGKAFVTEHKSNQFVFIKIFIDSAVSVLAPVDLIELLSIRYFSQTVAAVGFIEGFGGFFQISIAKAKGVVAPEQKLTQGVLVELPSS